MLTVKCKNEVYFVTKRKITQLQKPKKSKADYTRKVTPVKKNFFFTLALEKVYQHIASNLILKAGDTATNLSFGDTETKFYVILQSHNTLLSCRMGYSS